MRHICTFFLSILLLAKCGTLDRQGLAGQWVSNNNIWYKSELGLNHNGTFKFHDQGCYGQKWTLGKWTDSNGIIILSSYKDFKRSKDSITMDLFDYQNEEKLKAQKGKTKLAYVPLKITIPKFEIYGPNDSIKVFFDNIHLQLINDTLKCITANEFVFGIKFVKNKNNR